MDSSLPVSGIDGEAQESADVSSPIRVDRKKRRPRQLPGAVIQGKLWVWLLSINRKLQCCWRSQKYFSPGLVLLLLALFFICKMRLNLPPSMPFGYCCRIRNSAHKIPSMLPGSRIHSIPAAVNKSALLLRMHRAFERLFFRFNLYKDTLWCS